MGKKILCELCDEKECETRCDICNDGRICDNCYIYCDFCEQKVCIVCQRDHYHAECYICKSLIEVDEYISCAGTCENVICEKCDTKEEFCCNECKFE